MSSSFTDFLICFLWCALFRTAVCIGDQDTTAEHALIHARDAIPAEYVARPYYPTPSGGWIPDWTASYAKASAVVSNMTLAEKVNLTSGTGYFMVWPGPVCLGYPHSCI